MFKTAEYIEFENGFFKEAAEQQCDVPFLKGMIAEADAASVKWATMFNDIEQEHPGFKVKLAEELIQYSTINSSIIKKALEPVNPTTNEPANTPGKFDASGSLHNFLNDSRLQELLNGVTDTEQGRGGIVGAAGGGLLGLVLGLLSDHPILGLMLGATAGGLFGGAFGNGIVNKQFGGTDQATAAKKNHEENTAGAPGAADQRASLLDINSNNPQTPESQAALIAQDAAKTKTELAIQDQRFSKENLAVRNNVMPPTKPLTVPEVTPTKPSTVPEVTPTKPLTVPEVTPTGPSPNISPESSVTPAVLPVEIPGDGFLPGNIKKSSVLNLNWVLKCANIPTAYQGPMAPSAVPSMPMAPNPGNSGPMFKGLLPPGISQVKSTATQPSVTAGGNMITTTPTPKNSLL